MEVVMADQLAGRRVAILATFPVDRLVADVSVDDYDTRLPGGRVRRGPSRGAGGGRGLRVDGVAT
jgi:hypothetical protein